MKLLLTIAATLLLASNAGAQSLYDFLYGSTFETDAYERPGWFQTGDSLFWQIISNDRFNFRGRPYFAGRVLSAEDTCNWFDEMAQPDFQDGIIFNAGHFQLPTEARSLRAAAQHFSNHNGRFMTWIRMQGDQGINVYQYPMGSVPAESLVAHVNPPWWGGVFIDGDVEVEGVLSGNLTIGCSGNMYLINDARLSGASRFNGDYADDRMPFMLGLVSEKNIIIRDNYVNGKRDGFNEERNNPARHSIIINAAMAALGGSFTFQHQNDTGEVYQGPSPDERGRIWLKGVLFQKHRGILHNDNHGGTGYYISARYDSRFVRFSLPPFFPTYGETIPSGRYGYLELQSGTQDFPRVYHMDRVVCDSIFIPPRCYVYISQDGQLIVREAFRLHAGRGDSVSWLTPRQNSVLFPQGEGSVTEIVGTKGSWPDYWGFRSEKTILRDCYFLDEATFEGGVEATGCTFEGKVHFTRDGRILFRRNVLLGGVDIPYRNEELRLENNTIVGAAGKGIELSDGENVILRNNIVAFNRYGIYNRGLHEPEAVYNVVFGSAVEDFTGAREGEGSFSEDPRFVNAREGDYRLREDSPCIDAGDPSSPRDPDGTRADVGAFFYPHPMTASAKPPLSPEFNIAVSPNPFNDRTTISVRFPTGEEPLLRLHDLSGRVLREWRKEEEGLGRIALDGSGLPAGVYLLRAESENFGSSVKVVKVD